MIGVQKKYLIRVFLEFSSLLHFFAKLLFSTENLIRNHKNTLLYPVKKDPEH